MRHRRSENCEENGLYNFRKNFIDFLKEFTKENSFNLSEQKIDNLIDIHKLDLQSLKNDYFEKPIPWNTSN